MAKNEEVKDSNYSCEIISCTKELSAKERVMIKDTTNTVKLEQALDTEDVIVDVDYCAELAIHNEKADNADYNNYIVADKNGTRYRTGSTSFWQALKLITDEMIGVEEDWKLKIYKAPSQKREGKFFITCSVI